MVAVTFTEKLAAVADTTNATAYATSSWAPTAAKAYLLFVAGVKTTSPPIASPTVTGNGATWVQETPGGAVPLYSTSDEAGVFCFRTRMGGSPVTEATTITFPALVQGCCHYLVEVAGEDTSGTNGSGMVGNGDKNDTDTTAVSTLTVPASGSVTLSAGSSVIACYGMRSAPTGWTPESGWTHNATAHATHATPNQGIAVTWREDNVDGSATFSWTGGSGTAGAVVVEVKAAAGNFAQTVTDAVGVGDQPYVGGVGFVTDYQVAVTP